MKINWRLMIGVVISLIAFWLIVKDVDPAHLMTALTQANYWWLIPNTAFTLYAMFLRGYRWRALLDNRLSAARAFHISNVGNMLNNVLPLRLGELARAYLASRSGEVSTMQCFSTVIVERLLDVLTVFGFLLIVLPFAPADDLFIRAGTATAAFAFSGVVALFVVAAWREPMMALAHRRLAWAPAALREPALHHGDDFLRGIQAINPRRLLTGIGLSILVWLGWMGGCWMMLLGFVPDAPWYVGVFVTCAIALGLTIPSAPSGAGLYEAAVVAALALFKIPADIALAYGLMLHVSGFIVTALFGVYGLNVEGQSFAGITEAAQGLLARKTS